MFAFFLPCLLVASTSVNFSGRVLTETGEPLGGAIVVIASAKPRVGPSMMCPSCYPDCAKRAITDEHGSFEFEGVSDALLFRLAAGASNYQGNVTIHVDPLQKEPIAISLRSLPSSKGIHRITGTVTGDDGKPIVGCEVATRTETSGSITSSRIISVTPISITDERGKFVVTAEDRVEAVQFRLNASGYAETVRDWHRDRATDLKIEMKRGASLTGRLAHGGRPIPHVYVGIVQKDRGIHSVVTPMEVATDEEGVFRFDNLPAGLDYVLYTHTGQEIERVLPPCLVNLPRNNELSRLGDVDTEPARGLKIIVRMLDGTSIPEDCMMGLARTETWHSVRANASKSLG